MVKKLYEMLGVDEAAGEKEIRGAYRKLAKTAHPDRGGDRAAWDDLTRALAVLTDPERRKRYDETGEIDPEGADNARAAAITLLEKFFFEIINEYLTQARVPHLDPRTRQVKAEMMEKIDGQIEASDENVAQGESYMALMEDLKGRWSTATEPPEGEQDPIRRGLQRQIDEAIQKIAGVRNAIVALKLARSILETYEYRADPAIPRSGMAFVNLPPNFRGGIAPAPGAGGGSTW